MLANIIDKKNGMKKITVSVCALLLLLLVLMSCGAKEQDVGFSFAVSLTDGMEVTEKQLDFRAHVFYKGQECRLEVNCNGILAEPENDRYRVNLQSGENRIEIRAVSGEREESRDYTVVFRRDFTLLSDIEEREIADDCLTFTVNTLFNGRPCACLVSHNEAVLTPENDGLYRATLTEGENRFLVTAREGEYTEQRQWTVSYENFRLSTDLADRDVAKNFIAFRALAQYGGKRCDISADVGGVPIPYDQNQYTAMLQKGSNLIRITASYGKVKKSFSYTVRYFDDPPTLKTSLADTKTYLGSICNFDVMARDGLGNKLPAKSISFSVDWTPDDGVEQYVAVENIGLVWDDSTMSSFRIRFSDKSFSSHASQPFCLKITATDGCGQTTSAVYTMTYIPTAYGEKIGEVVFSLEGFSIGCGYFIEPVRIPIYEGVPFARMLTGILEERGLTYRFTGTLNSGFYLASVGGLDLTGNRIADGLWEAVKDSCVRSIDAGGELGEFDFGIGSGWMYSVNGVYKNYGFSDYYPQDGDTVRVQFTVLLGEDLGGGGALGGGSGGSLLGDNPDYAPIMGMIADIRAAGLDMTVCEEVMAVITGWNLSQDVMDEQTEKLKRAYGGNL